MNMLKVLCVTVLVVGAAAEGPETSNSPSLSDPDQWSETSNSPSPSHSDQWPETSNSPSPSLPHQWSTSCTAAELACDIAGFPGTCKEVEVDGMLGFMCMPMPDPAWLTCNSAGDACETEKGLFGQCQLVSGTMLCLPEIDHGNDDHASLCDRWTTKFNETSGKCEASWDDTDTEMLQHFITEGKLIKSYGGSCTNPTAGGSGSTDNEDGHRIDPDKPQPDEHDPGDHVEGHPGTTAGQATVETAPPGPHRRLKLLG